MLTGSTLLSVLLVAAPIAAAQAEEAPAPDKNIGKTNVLITLRIGKLEDSKRIPVKSYQLVVADGTPGSKLLSGQRVPFPTASKQSTDEAGDGSEDASAFIYQNVGFVAEARAWLVDEKTIKLIAEIEDSRVREGQDGEPPVVETRQLRVNAMLTDGVPLELTRVEALNDQSGFVEVEARILR
jgi:hypothetical protein